MLNMLSEIKQKEPKSQELNDFKKRYANIPGQKNNFVDFAIDGISALLNVHQLINPIDLNDDQTRKTIAMAKSFKDVDQIPENQTKLMGTLNKRLRQAIDENNLYGHIIITPGRDQCSLSQLTDLEDMIQLLKFMTRTFKTAII